MDENSPREKGVIYKSSQVNDVPRT